MTERPAASHGGLGSIESVSYSVCYGTNGILRNPGGFVTPSRKQTESVEVSPMPLQPWMGSVQEGGMSDLAVA
jgi:hypothetical protein